MDPVSLLVFREGVKSGAQMAYTTARQDYDSRKSLLTCDVGKLYIRVLKARCKIQAGVFRGNQTGKKMYEDAIQEEEELLEKFVAAVKENGSCARITTTNADEIKSSQDLTITIPLPGHEFGTMGEGDIAKNVHFAELWCKLERDHNLKEAFGMALFGYWTGTKKATKSCRRV